MGVWSRGRVVDSQTVVARSILTPLWTLLIATVIVSSSLLINSAPAAASTPSLVGASNDDSRAQMYSTTDNAFPSCPSGDAVVSLFTTEQGDGASGSLNGVSWSIGEENAFPYYPSSATPYGGPTPFQYVHISIDEE